MILVADSGSTSCDWILIDENKEIKAQVSTQGINPVMFHADEIKARIAQAEEILTHASEISELYFYSAGCATAKNRSFMKSNLQVYYPNAEIEVQSDTVAAVRATTQEAAIVCILGTGSNSCYFDGQEIHQGYDSLGFSVMDEASGNYFGKQFLRDYFYNKMPAGLALEFEQLYDLDTDEVLTNLYKKPMPAQYLASFARFIFHKNMLETDYIQNVISAAFEEYIHYQIKYWENYKDLPVHFVGSIAYFTKDILEEKLAQEEIKLGNIIRQPIEALWKYHVAKH